MNRSRDAFLEDLKQQVSPKRFEHILRVEAKAITLAKQYHGDVEKASVSSLLHDYAKEMPIDVLKHYREAPNYCLEWEKYGSAIWHGPLAAYIGRDMFGIDDPEILGAVWGHTIGKKDMSLNEKILFVADYIEDGRDFPGVDDVRALADSSLDDAVNYKLKASLKLQIERENPIFPETIAIYNDWMEKRRKYDNKTK